jgi:hypothetical protein
MRCGNAPCFSSNVICRNISANCSALQPRPGSRACCACCGCGKCQAQHLQQQVRALTSVGSYQLRQCGLHESGWCYKYNAAAVADCKIGDVSQALQHMGSAPLNSLASSNGGVQLAPCTFRGYSINSSHLEASVASIHCYAFNTLLCLQPDVCSRCQAGT